MAEEENRKLHGNSDEISARKNIVRVTPANRHPEPPKSSGLTSMKPISTKPPNKDRPR
jgi:hypothetical protein